MSPFRRLWNVVRRTRMDDDLRQEFDTHLALIEEEERAHGLDAEDARQKARLRFGNPVSYRERTLDAIIATWLENAGKDVRHAVRMLRTHPGFTTVAVLSLALGIGVSTAMFSVINAVLLRALPYPNPAQLVRVVQRDGRPDVTLSEYEVAREQSRVFSSIAAYRGAGERRLSFGGGQDWISAMVVTTDFLRTLGVQPAIGREFDASETAPGGPQAVILTDGLWRRSFGADPSILGRAATINDSAFTIVGVLPAGFWFPQQVDALLPLRPTGNLTDIGMNTQTVARLKGDVPVQHAQAEIGAMTETFRRARAATAPPSYQGLSLVSYHDWLVGDVRVNLLLLFGATGLLLLISCANLAMLLMTRFAARGREVALRIALGGGRSRLLTQFLIENLVLAAFGLAAGVLVSYALLRGLIAWTPFNLPTAMPVGLDTVVLGFALTIAIVTAIVFTVIPLLTARRLNVHDALKSAGRAPSLGLVRGRTRNVLVIAEVALSTTLVIAAGLLIQSLYHMQQERLGFAPEGLITFVTPFEPYRLRTADHRRIFTRDLRERLESIHGVHSVAATNVLPLAGRSNMPAQRDGHPEQSMGAMEIRMVTPGFFEAMGIPVRRGRSFTDQDAATASVVLVNESVARSWWEGTDPVGDRLVIGVFQGKSFVKTIRPLEVIGVVGDTKTTTLREPPRPTVFIPLQEVPASLTWIVKTDGSADVTAQLRAAITGLDPAQRVLQLRTMNAIVESTTGTSRFNAWLFAIFASVALALAVVGLYGILSFLVAQRTQEIGTRMALGASHTEVVGLFLSQGIRLTVVGLGLGLATALMLTRWLSTLLYKVQPNDSASFATVAVVLFFVGVAASYLPARRAARIHPMAALRSE
jgi:putative ABC transport system permease protein